MSDTEVTAKQMAMTNYDVYVALSERLDAGEKRAVERNFDLMQQIEGIKGTLREHDRRIGAVERRDAPRSHGIALGAIAVASWLAVLLFAVTVAALVTHAPAAFPR